MTRVLLVGGGAREHAMARALDDAHDAELVAVSENANPGIRALAERWAPIAGTDVDEVARFADRHEVDLAVVGPEAPLEAGIAGALEEVGVRVASPSAEAARIETSKVFMRELMAKHRVPGRVGYHVVESVEEAKDVLPEFGGKVAVKPEGLTGGKGVKVTGDHLQDQREVLDYVEACLEGSIGGTPRVVLEEKLEGEEFTLQAFSDGTHVVPMPAVQDHKRLLEGDEGPNTGGMGSYSDADHELPFLDEADYDEATYIVRKIVTALRDEGCPYTGVIYGQFMVTAEGPKIVEVNARLGDPEAMNVLSLLNSDYLEICQAMVDGDLDRIRARFSAEATVVKYGVPPGYAQGDVRSGEPISVDEDAVEEAGATLYWASVDEEDGRTVTTTSRTLAVLGTGGSIAEAEKVCEAGLAEVDADLHVRHDIGKPELVKRRIRHLEQLRTGG